MTTLKVWAISDTHNKHESLLIPSPLPDILIHCGDITKQSGMLEYESFAGWLNSIPVKYKVLVLGNHDMYFMADKEYRKTVSNLFDKNTFILREQLLKIESLHIFGSYVETKRCPEGIDILVTHEPPWGKLDQVPPYTRFNKESEPIHLGSHDLRDQVMERIYPRYHLFGHVHEQGGRTTNEENISFYNCAVLDEYYELVRSEGRILEIPI